MTALADAGKAAIQGLTYGYDAANNVLSIADAVTSGNSQSFGYDALDRLTSATGGYGSLGYTYDANGNRLTETPAGAHHAGRARLHYRASRITRPGGSRAPAPERSRLRSTLTMRSAIAWSKSGSVTAMTLFQYDQRRSSAGRDRQSGQRPGRLYLSRRPADCRIQPAGKLYFLHDDRLGTPQVATDTTQAPAWVGNYQPFGALTATSQTALLGQDLRLPGQENDLETGLYHNGFRDYAPGWGRYVQSDPIGLGGGMNAYAYAAGNPLARSDPHGTDLEVDIYPLAPQPVDRPTYQLHQSSVQEQLDQISGQLCRFQQQQRILQRLLRRSNKDAELLSVISTAFPEFPELAIWAAVQSISTQIILTAQDPTSPSLPELINSLLDLISPYYAKIDTVFQILDLEINFLNSTFLPHN